MQNEALEMPLVYRDDAIAVFEKPSGLLVHRGWGLDRITALDLARDTLGMYVYPVHRIDRATSGLLLFALCSEMASRVQASFEASLVEKRYWAIVRGNPGEGLIDHPIPRREDGPRVEAQTRFGTLGASGRFSLVEAHPLTGRLHQVRRHMKHISHPLVGDVNYGKGDINRLFRQDYGLHRLALHASGLCLVHPVTGERLCFESPMPDDMAGALRLLGIEVPGVRTSLGEVPQAGG